MSGAASEPGLTSLEGGKNCLSMATLMHDDTEVLERLRITFTSNSKRKFVPRDQVFSLLVVYCSLFLHLN